MLEKIVALLTDFGSRDVFVGIMKGTMLSVDASVRCVDLTHAVPPQDVQTGAFELYSSYRYFPVGTVFCAVVDPGVGSERKPVAVETSRYRFVGPDNGLLFPAVNDDKIKRIVSIENEDIYQRPVATTFHGRDIFAPAAAHLAAGMELERLGPVQKSLIRLDFPEQVQTAGGLKLTFLYIDTFGNIVLNIRREDLNRFLTGRGFDLRIGSLHITSLREHYTQAEMGELFLIDGSFGYLEISARDQSAADILNVEPGDTGILSRQ
jgi:S-adenosylmethionine hydrolase